jgi:hypothetical protein
MMKRLTTATLAVLMVAALPGVAAAQEQTTEEPPAVVQNRETAQADREAIRAETEAKWVETVKARALEAIDKRLATIADLQAAIDRSETVDPDHAGRLKGELQSSESGLEALARKIAHAEDLATLRELVPQIFEDYRIYAVVAPKVHLVLTADAASAVAERLGEAAGWLGDVLDRLAENGFDVEEAEELLVEMERLVASGGEGAAAVPDMVIGLKPSDYPDSTEVLRSAHGELKSAGSDLRSAGQAAHEIARIIKSVVDGGTG